MTKQPASPAVTPVSIVPMRNSERSTYRRCRLKHHWTYTERRAPEYTKGALTFGTLGHKCLEVRYPPGKKRGPHPAKTFDTLYKSGEYDFSQWDDEGNRIDAYDLGMAMMEGYVDKWGEDKYIEIIQPEMRFQVDVYDRQGNYLCTWVGSGDAVFRDLLTGRLGILEHKTAKSIEEVVHPISGYGEQGISYLWGATHVLRHRGLLAEAEEVDHVRFNWLKKALPDTRPVNAEGFRLNKPNKDLLIAKCSDLGLNFPKRVTIDDLSALLLAAGEDPLQCAEVSKVQPSPLFHRYNLDVSEGQLENLSVRIRGEAWEMAQVRAGKLPMLKNPTKDCSWDCPFHDACEHHSLGGEWQDILDMEFVTWDPYSDHELLEEKSRG